MSKTFFFSLFLLVSVLVQAASDTIRVACIGNSITFGAGIKNRAIDSYPAVLGQLLGDHYLVRNFGYSGRTCLNKGNRPYMKESMYLEALAFQPHIVVIKLGSNDTKPQNWRFQSEFKQDLTTLITSFEVLASHPRIYLCYPATAYAVQWGINDSTIVHGVIPYIDEVANEKGLKVIDLHQATSGMPENFPDNIHPNPTGAGIIATAVYEVVRQTTGTTCCKQAVKVEN